MRRWNSEKGYNVQTFNGLTIDEVVEAQSELFQRLSVKVEPYSREDDCYVNCMKKVEKDGGAIVVGWRKDRAITDTVEILSTLTHHAVWKSAEGRLIDITPHRILLNGKMEIVTPNYVDFMPDPTANFDDLDNARNPITIPSAPDRFGYLKQACIRMDKRWLLNAAGEKAKADYEEKKIVELIQSHIRRSDGHAS